MPQLDRTLRSRRVAQVFHEPVSAKVLVERMELVRHLVDEAQRIAPDRITFHWSSPCQVKNSVLPQMPPSEDLPGVTA